MSNRFALYTATLRNAQLAGIGDVTGSIEPGKSADFIVTKHDPLKDLRALQHLELVVCRGHVVKKPNPKRNKTVDALLDPYLAYNCGKRSKEKQGAAAPDDVQQPLALQRKIHMLAITARMLCQLLFRAGEA